MKTVRLSDFSPYNRNKGKTQELRHKFRNQILEYWGEDNLMVDGYDDDNEKIEGVDVYYDQISEIVYLAKIILEEMEEKDHGESS